MTSDQETQLGVGYMFTNQSTHGAINHKNLVSGENNFKRLQKTSVVCLIESDIVNDAY